MAVFNLPNRITDLLDAVNVCLSAIGEAPVSDFNNSEAVDVALAQNLINEADKDVQNEGWTWNRENALKLLPDGSGNICLPEQTLRVGKAYWISSPNSPCLVHQRGDKLYNADDHSFVFPEGVKVDLVIRQKFTDIPDAARRLIAILAAQRFQGRYQTSSTVDRILDRDVVGVRATLLQHEDEVEEQNAIEGNIAVQKAIHGRGVRRNR